MLSPSPTFSSIRHRLGEPLPPVPHPTHLPEEVVSLLRLLALGREVVLRFDEVRSLPPSWPARDPHLDHLLITRRRTFPRGVCCYANGWISYTLSVTWTDTDGTSFDNIELDVGAASAVPEPATVVLMGLGLVGLRVAGRRKLVS